MNGARVIPRPVGVRTIGAARAFAPPYTPASSSTVALAALPRLWSGKTTIEVAASADCERTTALLAELPLAFAFRQAARRARPQGRRLVPLSPLLAGLGSPCGAERGLTPSLPRKFLHSDRRPKGSEVPEADSNPRRSRFRHQSVGSPRSVVCQSARVRGTVLRGPRQLATSAVSIGAGDERGGRTD